MDILQWAVDPRGRDVPIHIAWFLIEVSFGAAVAFLIVHAAYSVFLTAGPTCGSCVNRYL